MRRQEESLQHLATKTPVSPLPHLVYRILHVKTTHPLEFVDLTDEIRALVRELGVEEGLVVVFSRHTTATLCIIEHEPLLIEDMERVLRNWAPPGSGYQHDDFDKRTVNMHDDERPNGHAHFQSLALNTSEMLPLAGGALLLGPWQSLFLVEHDGPREREVLVQIWPATA